jgi:hypothetical protein
MDWVLPMSPTLRLHCSHCAQIIGAYEPLVVRVDGHDRASSLAAEPALPLAGAAHLHAACAREAPAPETYGGPERRTAPS